MIQIKRNIDEIRGDISHSNNQQSINSIRNKSKHKNFEKKSVDY